MAGAAVRQAPLTMNVGAGAITGARSGVAYKLGQEIGAGGNGVIYTIARRPELVAKISKYALARHDMEKLDALVHGATPDLLNVAAWPIDCLKSSTGHVIGFVMPRILDARPLYELYSPRSRVQHFPSADFRFLVHTATNVARLFAAVHKAGFIAGDKFSAADVYVGSHIGWGMQFGSIEKRPAFTAYWDKISSRPAAVRAREIDDALLPAQQPVPA